MGACCAKLADCHCTQLSLQLWLQMLTHTELQTAAALPLLQAAATSLLLLQLQQAVTLLLLLLLQVLSPLLQLLLLALVVSVL
jgi:hypothetical protein